MHRPYKITNLNRQPLQDIILNLRTMLEDSKNFRGVVPVLEDLLEPPDMSNTAKSFNYLHYCKFMWYSEQSISTRIENF